MRTGTGATLVLALALASLVCPRDATAQRGPVVRALADLHAALDGTYGDESGEITRRLTDLSEAAADWDRSIRDTEERVRARLEGASPDDAARAHETLGLLYLERGRTADAVRELEAAGRLAPQRPGLHLALAFALDADDRSERAAAAFRHAWTLDADNPVAAYLAIARSAMDDADLARAHDTLVRAIRELLRGTRPGLSEPFTHPAPSLSQPGGAPLFALGRHADGVSLAIRGQIDEAVARLRMSLENDPLVVDPALRAEGMVNGAAALRRGTLREALAAFRNAVDASPRSSEARRMLATAAAIAGDARTSAEHFEAALRIRPDDERSWIALAETQEESGSLVEAVRTLEKAVSVIPGSGGLRWRLAGLMVRLEQVGDALAQYAEAERLTPMSGQAAVHQAVATSASLQQDVARAVTAGERRVRSNVGDVAAHRDLASLYTKQGRQDAAFAELAVAAWLDPDDPLTFVMLGHSLMAGRRDEDAVAALERAVSLQPDLRDARYALAQALTRTSRRADAERHLAEFQRQRAAAVEREQRALDISALRDEAATRSAAGQHRQAVQTWTQVIALEPEQARHYLNLAETLVRAGALEESLQYFVKTSELDGVADVHRRLTDVLARLGRTRESGMARDTYERLRLEDFRRRASPQSPITNP